MKLGPRIATVLLAIFAVCLIVLLAGTTLRAVAEPDAAVMAPRSSVPTATPITTAMLAQTANTLANTAAPVRDLISLTLRLKLGGAGTVPQVVNAQPPRYTAGSKQSFYIADVTQRDYFTATATLRYVTPHAYWYVKDGMEVVEAQLEASAKRFEAKIYPTDRAVFGHEASPGIDNDTHITVLIAPVPGVGGYFSAADALPRTVNPFSNQRDMIYMSTPPTSPSGSPDNYFEATLAHEFQHMIEWNIHRDRDVWQDEGAAEIAMYLNGYNAGGVDFAYSLNPDTQLNAWGDTADTLPHYGAAYLFLRYLMDKYGGQGFITKMVGLDLPGTTGIDTIIKQAGNTAGFDGAFKDWTVANVLNDSSIVGGRYSYSSGGRVQPEVTVSQYPTTKSGTVHQYAADYIALSGTTGPATITFKGSSTVPVVATQPHSGQYFYYANRQDNGDATLTRQFDLSTVRHATLQFWIWYDTERLFDYAYAEASSDGGKSWTPLKGKYTTAENPNGASFGAGWTGKSGVAATSASGTSAWMQETMDLSAYAGKRVLVRFEYVTDEGYNRPGFALDDIRIPEIGFTDTAENSNGGWTAQGFTRIGGNLPEKWFVALIEKGSTNRVREMVVNSNGSGSIDLSSFGPNATTRSAILVIAPLAPKTTEVGSYTVSVKPR